MKIIICLFLVSVALCHEDFHQQYKNWAQKKAMDSCWGEDNMKVYHISMKEAVAKCTHQDAPELNLPEFRSPYKTVNVLLNSAEYQEQDEMRTIFQMMRLMKQYKEMQHKNMQNEYNSVRPYSNDFNRNDDNMMDDQWMAKMLMNIMMKNNIKNDMSYDNHHSSYSNMPNRMDRLDSMEKMMNKYFEQKKQYGEHNAFKSNSNKQDKYNMFNKMYDVAEARDTFRYKRQAVRHSLPNLDLGDRFEAKLQAEKQRTNEKIGNMTCILQELNVLDNNNKISIPAIRKDMAKYTPPSKWFKTRYEQLLDTCYEMATTLPGTIEKQYQVQYEVKNENVTVNVAQIKTFMQCFSKAKRQLCMDQDVKRQIETNFGQFNEILARTELTEQQLFLLVRTMLQGHDNEFDFSM